MKRKVLILTLVSLLCLSSAFAGANYKEIGVYFGAVSKIFVDGEDKTQDFKEPFIYNGTTYIALRDVSTALNKDVNWDAENRTIYLGAKPISFRIENTELTDLTFYANHNLFIYRENNLIESVYNMDLDASYDIPDYFKMKIRQESDILRVDEYERGITLKIHEDATALYYNLKGEYDIFTGKIGYDYTENNDQYGEVTARIKLDSKIVKEIKLSTTNIQEEFNISVSNGEIMQIEFLREKDLKFEPIVNIVNPSLEKHIYE